MAVIRSQSTQYATVGIYAYLLALGVILSNWLLVTRIIVKNHDVLALSIKTVFYFQQFTFRAKNKTNKKSEYK